MAKTFNCPSCGAPLETDGHEASIHCEYCGATVIVPTELLAPAPIAGESVPAPAAHPSQMDGPHGKLSIAQMRQMMGYIRAGQLDDAIKTFQEGTGANGEMAGQTVQAIANQISASNLILPAALAAIMGAYAESAGRSYLSLQPAIAPRRRSRGIGCGPVLAIMLVIVLVYFYFSITAISPATLVNALAAGNTHAAVIQTAVAPFHAIATALAPVFK